MYYKYFTHSWRPFDTPLRGTQGERKVIRSSRVNCEAICIEGSGRTVKIRYAIALLLSSFIIAHELPLVLVCTSYNNAAYYQKNLDSIFSQKYDNYRVIYIDDASQDQTGKLVAEYVRAHHQEERFTIIINDKNIGGLANHYKAAHLCYDHEIILVLDGDDWFIDNQVLKYMNNIYANPNIWMTYGELIEYPDEGTGYSTPVPISQVLEHNFREWGFNMSHLRSYYAWLFKRIDEKDLHDEDGNYIRGVPDLAMMFPLIEMAADHFKCIKKVIYVWNHDNPINEIKVIPELTKVMDKFVRFRQKRYPKIEQRCPDFVSDHPEEYSFEQGMQYIPIMKNKITYWHIIEHNYEKIRKKDALGENGMPKIIHSIQVGPMTKEKETIIASWKHFHPDWTIKIWHIDQPIEFELVNKKLFEYTKCDEIKKIILICEILNKYGGICVDEYFECIRSFDYITHRCNFFAGIEPISHVQVGHWIMGSQAGHRLIEEIHKLLSLISVDTSLNNIRTLLTKNILQYLARDHDDALILPCDFFYSLYPWQTKLYAGKYASIGPVTFALYHWH